ncbi:MAG TPA: DUF2442 domain-containing protein [Longimicrobium sp.]|nr:DUF2442 domain-containing protein [Longimicrobium sp.]
MAKQPPPLDDALRAQFEAAREADRIADLTEPRASDAFYDVRTGRIVVELKMGSAFAFPPALYPELQDRTPQELARVEVSPSGEGLHWDEIDVHIETAGVLVAIMGPAMFRAFASVGGRATSERKAAAARANGARGGRPRKQPSPPEPERLLHRFNAGSGLMQVAEVRQTGRPEDPNALETLDPE